MELEDIVYELACLHESMLFCCMALRRIIRTSKRPNSASALKRPPPNPLFRKVPRRLPPGHFLNDVRSRQPN